jgi:hypothetical protein
MRRGFNALRVNFKALNTGDWERKLYSNLVGGAFFVPENEEKGVIHPAWVAATKPVPKRQDSGSMYTGKKPVLHVEVGRLTGLRGREGFPPRPLSRTG